MAKIPETYVTFTFHYTVNGQFRSGQDTYPGPYARAKMALMMEHGSKKDFEITGWSIG